MIASHKLGYLLYSVVLSMVLLSCRNIENNALNKALNSSGSNRQELQKVLDHYDHPADSLKLKAAAFLIQHMVNKRSYESRTYERYALFFKEVKGVLSNDTLDVRDKKIRFSFIYDSLQVDKATQGLELKEDIEFIKASYLIENIDKAFLARDSFPWSASVPFEDFCQYVLPYKVFNEPMVPWRKTLMDRYRWVLDSIKNPKSLREATILINKRFNKGMTYFTRMNRFPTSLDFKTLDDLKIGACEHLVTMNVYHLRAMGIPAQIDYTKWGNHDGTHTRCSITDENGELFSFDALYQPKNVSDSLYMNGLFNHIPESNLRKRKAPKIYRVSFENKEQHLPKNQIALSGIVPKELIDPNAMDVTAQYANPTATIELEIPTASNEDIAILNVFNGYGWQPIAWSMKNQNESFRFENMGTDIMYLNTLKNAKDGSETKHPPFILRNSGSISTITANKDKLTTILLDRKYFIDHDLKLALNKMVGGVFQGANSKDFRDAVDLHTITTVPKPKTNRYEIQSIEKFRYIRFILPQEQCRVAEMKLFKKTAKDKEPILLSTNQLISSNKGNNHAEKIMDGDVLTYFVADNKENGWIGYDLGPTKETVIASIDFYPPNDGNSIEIGDKYELFYWDDHWKSLGIKIAKEEKLVFTNCPDNALFLLKNHTKGVQVRIFTYEQNEQRWW